MEVSSNNDTDNNGDDAIFFDFVVGRDAIGEVFGNLTIEKNSEAAAKYNNEANNHPGNTKRPV